ncbi:MAG: alanine--glyoxylate aminotransferase family protein [Gemmatimonadales bacterium]|nr:MAG: alanine--glyoxylate aminotransferase family protein [Gemmatimonadales bacterium]
MRVSSLQPRLLLGPGPSPVSERIREAMARPTLGHLDPQFLGLLDDVNARLRTLFGTRNQTTFPLSGTGSAGMEAAMVNLIAPGDQVLVGVNGVFGTRLAEMGRRMGAEVVTVEAPWGEILPEERLIDALEAYPGARLLALVHAETSTGVLQPLEQVGAWMREREPLLVVDAVTSLGGVPVAVDAVGIDVCYSGTQKCLGVPPGLSPITFSEKALGRVRSRTAAPSSWYLDVSLIAGYLGSERRYHHTAPINLIYALHESLVEVEEEGIEARYRRHREVGRQLQEALGERGFEPFAQEGHRLPQLTSAYLPDGLAEAPLRRRLLEDHGIEVGGGLGPVSGKIWRIGLMGEGARRSSVDRLVAAVDSLLERDV